MKNKSKLFGNLNRSRNVKVPLLIIALTAVFAFSTVTCSGSGGGGKSINSPEELKAYLDRQPANIPGKPIKITMNANEVMIPKIVAVLKDTGKYVSLNFSGNALTTIPEGAFRDCTSLVSVTIPKSVTSIGENAFQGCTSLVSVTIGNSVTSIGYEAFTDCTSLTSVTIPNSVTYINTSAFRGCTSLTSITFQGTITSDNFGEYPFTGDLRTKYLAGGIGTYKTTAPVGDNSVWTKS